MKKKLVRITTVPISLRVLLRQQLKFMSAHFDVLAVSSPGTALDEVCSSEGVRVASIVMTRSVSPVKDIKALWRLYRLFRKERPAIVHTHTPKAGLLGMIAARMAGVPVRLHTVAGLPLMEKRGIMKKVLEVTERLTYTCATKIYPNSGNLASWLLKHRYCQAGKLKVLGNGSSNGIDTDFFQLNEPLQLTAGILRKQLQIGQDDFVFVFVGRLVRDKGIEELVAAFTALQNRYVHIKLLLVGPYEPHLDPLSVHTKEIIETGGHIIRVDFQHDIRPYLAISRVLVFPSYREGFPNVPLQAGCFHLPAIVTDINGCNEIIEHKRNGLIVPAKNSAALQHAMESLLVNDTLYEALKKNTRQLVVERYEQKQFWSLLLHEYDDQLHAHAVLS
jgi:glycosyltransferase involved in cell wall biosynthesis